MADYFMYIVFNQRVDIFSILTTSYTNLVQFLLKFALFLNVYNFQYFFANFRKWIYREDHVNHFDQLDFLNSLKKPMEYFAYRSKQLNGYVELKLIG